MDGVLTKNGIPVLSGNNPPSKKQKERILENNKNKMRNHKSRFDFSDFKDKQISIYWDIENISKSFILNSNHHYIHNAHKKFISHAINTLDFSFLEEWERRTVTLGDDAADHDIIEEIINDMDNYDLFIVISNDNIFLEVIDELLEKEKHVLLLKTNNESTYFNKHKEIINHSNFYLDFLIKDKVVNKAISGTGSSFVENDEEKEQSFIKRIFNYILRFFQI